jgi:hypothetical protein
MTGVQVYILVADNLVFENNDVFLKVDVLNCYAQANGKNTE